MVTSLRWGRRHAAGAEERQGGEEVGTALPASTPRDETRGCDGERAQAVLGGGPGVRGRFIFSNERLDHV